MIVEPEPETIEPCASTGGDFLSDHLAACATNALGEFS